MPQTGYCLFAEKYQFVLSLYGAVKIYAQNCLQAPAE